MMQEHKEICMYVGLEEGGCVDVASIALGDYRLVDAQQLAALKAERNVLLEALEALLENHCPLTGEPSYKDQVEHWEYEQSQGRGDAYIYLQAIGAVLVAKAGA